MRLNELRTANDLLDDVHRLAARYEHDGSLLVQGALDSTTIADITDEAASALRRCGKDAWLPWLIVCLSSTGACVRREPKRRDVGRHGRRGRSRRRARAACASATE